MSPSCSQTGQIACTEDLMVLQLRLTPDQNDQKQAAELAVKEAQDELEAETDTEKKDALKAEIADRQEKLTSLVSGFEVRHHSTVCAHFQGNVCLCSHIHCFKLHCSARSLIVTFVAASLLLTSAASVLCCSLPCILNLWLSCTC